MKNLLIRYGKTPKEAFAESARFTAITLLCIVLAMLHPVFQLTLVLVPALYTALTHRNGILFSVLSFAIVLLSVSLSTGNYPLIFFLGILSSMGILVGEASYRKNNMMMAIMLGAMVIILNFVAMIYIQNKISGGDFVEYMLNSYFAMVEENGLGNMVNFDLIELKNMMRMTLPAIILSSGISFGVLNYFFAGSIINKMNKGLPIYRYFWEFSLPGSALIAVFVSIIGVGIADLVSGYSAEVLIDNLKILYSTLFFIQGLSLIDFLFIRRFKPFMRALIFVVLIFTVFTYPFLTTMGALDLIFNFRRIRK